MKAKRQSKYTVGDYRVEIKRGLSGKGLFSLGEIPKGKCIIEYAGDVVPEKYHCTKTGRYLFWAGKNKMIDGNTKTNTAKYINHSCRPNCEATGPDGKIFIMSLRKIKPEEELTYNYDKEYFNEYIKPKGCNCIKCKKVI